MILNDFKIREPHILNAKNAVVVKKNEATKKEIQEGQQNPPVVFFGNKTFYTKPKQKAC